MKKLRQIFAKDRWVKPFFRKYWRACLLSLLLGVCTFISAGALMFTSGFLISKSASLPMNIMLVYVPIVLTRAFGIARPVFQYAERLTSHNWVLKMTSMMRLKLYKLLEKEAIFLQGNRQTGELIDILSDDIDKIQNLYLRTIFPTIVGIAIYTLIVVALGVFSIPFAILMMILLAFIVFVIPMYSLLHLAYNREKEKTYRHVLYNELTDNVLGINDWVVSNRKTDYINHHEQVEAKHLQYHKAITKYERKRDIVIQIVVCFVVVALFIWSATDFKGIGHDKVNYIAAFVLTVFPLIDVFAPISTSVESLNLYGDSVQRLNHLSQEEPKNEVKKIISLPHKGITCQNLTFSYDERRILDGINLQIKPGEKIAILGRSGVGKSTLASLIRGDLVPTSGGVTLGGIETKYFGEEMAKYIGVIQQSTYIFNTSVLNNIRLGNEQASIDEVWHILEEVGLKERVESLPHGLEEEMQEAGFGFSGGELQRFALARILISETPIIILDEPTVGLDPLTEKQVLDLFFDKLQDRTIIWITHHLQGIKNVDRIIFLQDGKIAMNDTYENLLETNEHFQELVSFEQA